MVEVIELSNCWLSAMGRLQVSDFVNPDTGVMLLPHELPLRVQSIIDGFEVETKEYDTEDGTVKETKIKYKLTPHAVAREQAMKHEGLFAPEKIEGTIAIDWGTLHKRAADVIDVNPVQKRLEEEKGAN